VVPFTDFRPGSGVRAVILESDLWGVDGRVTGLAEASYAREPADVAIQLANTVDQPFRVNRLDASEAIDLDGDLHRQILFADVGIDRLPQQIRVRQQDVEAGSDEPWLWVNTEDLTIDDLDEVDFTEDPAGTRPQLTGILRLGDLTML